MDAAELAALLETIARAEGCRVEHVETVPVTETFQGKTAWTGDVATFALDGHAKATRAYGWTYATDEGKRRYVVILGLGPVTSPQTAVQAYLVAEAKKRGVA